MKEPAWKKWWRLLTPEKRKLVLRQRYERRAAIIRAAKRKPCVRCKKKYPYYVMQFDHVRGKKVAGAGKMAASATHKQIRAEIAKCEVVCANCHAIRTHRRKQYANRDA